MLFALVILHAKWILFMWWSMYLLYTVYRFVRDHYLFYLSTMTLWSRLRNGMRLLLHFIWRLQDSMFNNAITCFALFILFGQMSRTVSLTQNIGFRILFIWGKLFGSSVLFYNFYTNIYYLESNIIWDEKCIFIRNRDFSIVI